MNFWEYLDRRSERRARSPLFRFDTKTLIGFGFLAGYYVMVYRFTLGGIPAENLPLVRDAMLTLGPPVGLIVGAIFRTDARDEAQTANTARALSTITEVARATGTNAPNPSDTGAPANPPSPESANPAPTPPLGA